MNNIYLVQHAEAMSEEENPNRPLNNVGRTHATDVAVVAAALGVDVKQIRHSGKTRAEQTAEIIGEELSPEHGVVAANNLGPLDDVEPVAEDLNRSTDPVMLVGHLPFMEKLAGYMLTGDAEQTVVDFNNAGIVCLKQEDGRWQVEWILSAEIAGIKT